MPNDPRTGLLVRECPRDRATLVKRAILLFGPDVTVDDCPRCGGVYLDKNELGRLTSNGALNRWLRDKTGYDVDGPLICPSCGGLMDLEHAHGVDVDVCLTCFGIWLDPGELEALKATKKGAPPLDAAKSAEIETKRMRDRERLKREYKAAGPYGAVKPLDDLLDEIVRRWL